MTSFRIILALLLGAFLVLIAPLARASQEGRSSYGQPAPANPAQKPSPWSLLFFAGVLSENKLGFDLMPPQRFRNDFMAGLALNWEFFRFRNYLDLELEPMFMQHFGNATYGELAGVVMVRWRKFPWNQCLLTTFAFGEGLSYVAQIPAIETRQPGVGPINHLNNLLILEATFAVAKYPHTAVVFRLHHRSVGLNLFGENNESNFFGLGLRYNF